MEYYNHDLEMGYSPSAAFERAEIKIEVMKPSYPVPLKLIQAFALPFATTLVATLLLPLASFNVLTLSSLAIMLGLRVQ